MKKTHGAFSWLEDTSAKANANWQEEASKYGRGSQKIQIEEKRKAQEAEPLCDRDAPTLYDNLMRVVVLASYRPLADYVTFNNSIPSDSG